jgi:voltage-gated potassium channel
MKREEADAHRVEGRFEGRKYRPLETLFLLDLIRDRDSRVPLFWAVSTLLLGMFAFHWLEGWSFLDALYFCVITLATIGFGDLTPTTPLAKAFTILYVINGIAILLALFDRIRVVRSRRVTHWREQAKDQ